MTADGLEIIEKLAKQADVEWPKADAGSRLVYCALQMLGLVLSEMRDEVAPVAVVEDE